MKRKKTHVPTSAEVVASQRGSWGSVNPVTKIIPDKRRKKPKYKGKEDE